MTTYHQEKINTTIAKIAECMARDPKRAERLLGEVKKWSAEAEREAYVRGKADAAPQASAEASTIEDLKKLFRQERDRAGAMRKALERIRDLRGTAGFERASITNEVQVFANEIARAALDLKSAPAAEDSAKGAGDADECNFSDLIDAYTDAVRNGKFSERVAARAELMNSYRQQRGGDVDERAAFERRFRIEPENWSTAGGGGYRNVWYEARWEGWKARAALAAQPAASAEPSDEEIDAIAASMPDGAGGMLKQWGYRQFARALLSSYGRPAGDAKPVAWRYQTPTGWHATTDAGKVLAIKEHHPVEALYAAPVAAQKADDARDAERYRWLKDLLDNEEVTAGLHEAFMAGPEAMDAALDAAIAQQRKGAATANDGEA